MHQSSCKKNRKNSTTENEPIQKMPGYLNTQNEFVAHGRILVLITCRQIIRKSCYSLLLLYVCYNIHTYATMHTRTKYVVKFSL